MLSQDDRRLIAMLHGGFPLSDRPFAELAAKIGGSEDVLLERLQRLLARGDLTRFGPLFQIERAGGRFVLAAMAVPEERFAEVAAQLDGMPEVAHNYRRESAFGQNSSAAALNMWFVVAVEDASQTDAVMQRIEAATELPVFAFPKEREYFVELKLPLLEERHDHA
ncbi:Lrp/AsnC family transcriptional regulator [Hydrogenophaga sp. 5NK40-0174]|uniref:Lrp/AsnC family transcriptional regulator n=1 Tax=Hydrogenophaga sp. 5NK40-0174 TaxID=3127649 RepID=UPI00310B685B